MKTVIIAEAGVNHNGSTDIAIKLIDAAASAGADIIKFQTFISEKTVGRFAPKANYQNRHTNQKESQLEMVKKLELSQSDYRNLSEYCVKKKIKFLSTPFDLESARFLVEDLNIPILKIASGEITNAPFLIQLAQYGLPIILSTGMSTLGEIEYALGALVYGYLKLKITPSPGVFLDLFISDEGQEIIKKNLTLLHCTSEYPAPFNQVNLRAMDTLKMAFNVPVGLSDHTIGIHVPIGAVARGAEVIEKHFTLDKNMPGPDHRASIEPHELTEMVQGIRQIESALGNHSKRPTLNELENRGIVRRSLVAAETVTAESQWTDFNLTCKRPGTGISPFQYWDYLGQTTKKAYLQDEVIHNNLENESI